MIDIFIQKGKEILCIRFVNVGGYQCIDEHLDIIKLIGYVWFGKIGSKPAEKVLKKMIEDNSNYILLKDPKYAYICKFDAYRHTSPVDSDFPAYYKSEIMPNRTFSIWFKLTSIKKVVDMNALENIVLKSSRSPILETARKSMASHFYTVARKDVQL